MNNAYIHPLSPRSMDRGQDRPSNMAIFKLSDCLHVLCFFLFVGVPLCLAIDASDELRHVRFIFAHNQTTHMDHCHNHCQHGVCVGQIYSGYHCQCYSGWNGVHCERQHSETVHMDQCHNHCQHGVCVGPVSGYYHCQCDPGWYGGHCEQERLDSNNTLDNSACDISAIMAAITKQNQVVNENTTECSTGSHSSHDALVLTHCHVPYSASSWKQGLNVMSRCSSLPANTPIAAFVNGVYSSKRSLSGIFIACTANGFKMAFQLCGQPPQIAEITMGGTNALNPAVYYTVV